MDTLIGLIMALLLAAQNPAVPAELRLQALSVASAALMTVQSPPVKTTQTPASPGPVGTVLQSVHMEPLEKYAAKFEESAEDRFYFWGNHKIVSATVNGVPAVLFMETEMKDSCVSAGVDNLGMPVKHCGGWSVRFTVPVEGLHVAEFYGIDRATGRNVKSATYSEATPYRVLDGTNEVVVTDVDGSAVAFFL